MLTSGEAYPGDARWVSSLHCGHQARTRGRPRPGSWITCPDGRCQGQRRVDAVAALPLTEPEEAEDM